MSKFLYAVRKLIPNQRYYYDTFYVCDYPDDATAPLADHGTRIVCAERCLYGLNVHFAHVQVYQFEEDDTFVAFSQAYTLWVQNELIFDARQFPPGWQNSNNNNWYLGLTLKRDTVLGRSQERRFHGIVDFPDLHPATGKWAKRGTLVLRPDTQRTKDGVEAWAEWLSTIPELDQNMYFDGGTIKRVDPPGEGDWFAAHASYYLAKRRQDNSFQHLLHDHITYNIHVHIGTLLRSMDWWNLTVKTFNTNSVSPWVPDYYPIWNTLHEACSIWALLAYVLNYDGAPEQMPNRYGMNEFEFVAPPTLPRRGLCLAHADLVESAIQQLFLIVQVSNTLQPLLSEVGTWPTYDGTDRALFFDRWAELGQMTQVMLLRAQSAFAQLQLHFKLAPPGGQWAAKRIAMPVRPWQQYPAPRGADGWRDDGIQLWEGMVTLPDAAWDFRPASNEAMIRFSQRPSQRPRRPSQGQLPYWDRPQPSGFDGLGTYLTAAWRPVGTTIAGWAGRIDVEWGGLWDSRPRVLIES